MDPSLEFEGELLERPVLLLLCRSLLQTGQS